MVPLSHRGQLALIFLVSCLVKLLTINEKLYFSTDFEVHRNWLAVTHSLPFSQWYKDNRNVWTLDYPPFFAYFEYALSWLSLFFDKEIVNPNLENYASLATIVFQRLTVILISDGVLALATIYSLPRLNQLKGLVLMLFSSSLFLVDHIHFQYNGMLLGLLLISASAAHKGDFYLSAFIYSALVYTKHIYLMCAPVFLVYFLHEFVLENRKNLNQIFTRLFHLIAIVIGVSFVAILPLVLSDQLEAAISRMFPFGRGLTHSYWAPNFWALYSCLDRVLGFCFGISGGKATTTSGIVGISNNAVLPTVHPWMTGLITLVAYIPLTWLMMRYSKSASIFTWIGLGNAIGFMFGWHVHEKAILMVLFPLLIAKLNAPRSSGDSRLEWMLSLVACISLLPLLPREHESVLKWLLCACGALSDSLVLDVDPFKYKAIVLVIASPELYRVLIHPLVFRQGQYPFLPLLINSVMSTVCIITLLSAMVIRLTRGPSKVKRI